MYTLAQAHQLQQDFTYIIEKERRIGLKTAQTGMTLFFGHGGTLKESYVDGRVSATMPTDKKYLALKAKYFSTDNLSIFYPSEFKKYLNKQKNS